MDFLLILFLEWFFLL